MAQPFEAHAGAAASVFRQAAAGRDPDPNPVARLQGAACRAMLSCATSGIAGLHCSTTPPWSRRVSLNNLAFDAGAAARQAPRRGIDSCCPPKTHACLQHTAQQPGRQLLMRQSRLSRRAGNDDAMSGEEGRVRPTEDGGPVCSAAVRNCTAVGSIDTGNSPIGQQQCVSALERTRIRLLAWAERRSSAPGPPCLVTVSSFATQTRPELSLHDLLRGF